MRDAGDQVPQQLDLGKLHYTKIPSKITGLNSLLLVVKQVEKKTFPASEVFDFDTELSKKTTFCYCAFYRAEDDAPILCGYLVYSRSRALTRINKVCVVKSMQGQGVGTFMMQRTLGSLRSSGAHKIDLWVDQSREIAQRLYRSCGFEEGEALQDYYAPGRNGIRMHMEL